MKEENKKKWDQAIGSLIPEPCTLGLVTEDRRPINRDEVTVVYGLDSRIKREVEPLTWNLGSVFGEVEA